jgi:hypothetical protein
MDTKAVSIRPFIGAKNFDISRNFYRDFGFEEQVLSRDMSVFHLQHLSFYLQDAYVEDWINNTMLFLEVANVDRYWKELIHLDLPSKYEGVRVLPVRTLDWGKECFIHDPSGVLWHVGEFNKLG